MFTPRTQFLQSDLFGCAPVRLETDIQGAFFLAGRGHPLKRSRNGKLRMRFSKTAQLVGTMTPWQHDTFIVRWDDRSLNADAFVNFSLDPDGKVREVRMQPISDLTDFSFDFQDLLFTPTAR